MKPQSNQNRKSIKRQSRKNQPKLPTNATNNNFQKLNEFIDQYDSAENVGKNTTILQATNDLTNMTTKNRTKSLQSMDSLKNELAAVQKQLKLYHSTKNAQHSNSTTTKKSKDQNENQLNRCNSQELAAVAKSSSQSMENLTENRIENLRPDHTNNTREMSYYTNVQTNDGDNNNVATKNNVESFLWKNSIKRADSFKKSLNRKEANNKYSSSNQKNNHLLLGLVNRGISWENNL